MNYYSYIDSLAIKAAKYDELKTKIKNIQDTIKSYELNEDSIFENERCLAQSLLRDVLEDIKSIDVEE